MKGIEALDLTREFVSEKGYLFKKKEKVLAVDHVDFEVEKGELFGFVGPNGAGKTTTVKMLCTLLLPTSGTARVLGRNIVERPDEVRARAQHEPTSEKCFRQRLQIGHCEHLVADRLLKRGIVISVRGVGLRILPLKVGKVQTAKMRRSFQHQTSLRGK